MQLASAPRFSEDGKRLPPDIRDVPKYAAVERVEDREPGMKTCYLIRGRMRLKFYYEESDNEVLGLLRRAMRAGVSLSAMNDAVDNTTTLEDCFVEMGIDRTEFRIAMGHPIVNLRSTRRFFVREEYPEWRLWDAYLRRWTGKGAPISRQVAGIFPAAFLRPSRRPRRRSVNAPDRRLVQSTSRIPSRERMYPILFGSPQMPSRSRYFVASSVAGTPLLLVPPGRHRISHIIRGIIRQNSDQIPVAIGTKIVSRTDSEQPNFDRPKRFANCAYEGRNLGRNWMSGSS